MLKVTLIVLNSRSLCCHLNVHSYVNNLGRDASWGASIYCIVLRLSYYSNSSLSDLFLLAYERNISRIWSWHARLGFGMERQEMELITLYCWTSWSFVHLISPYKLPLRWTVLCRISIVVSELVYYRRKVTLRVIILYATSMSTL